jgi:toxin FitB
MWNATRTAYERGGFLRVAGVFCRRFQRRLFRSSDRSPRDRLLVPTLSILEVFKRTLQQRSESDSLEAVAYMQQGEVVPLDARLALAAARLSLELKMPMAHSVIPATARAYQALLWTQDADFEGVEAVRYKAKR